MLIYAKIVQTKIFRKKNCVNNVINKMNYRQLKIKNLPIISLKPYKKTPNNKFINKIINKSNQIKIIKSLKKKR